jgi:hypothetical protein
MKARKIKPTPSSFWVPETPPGSALPPVDRCGGKRCHDCQQPTADHADRCYLCARRRFREAEMQRELAAASRTVMTWRDRNAV